MADSAYMMFRLPFDRRCSGRNTPNLQSSAARGSTRSRTRRSAGSSSCTASENACRCTNLQSGVIICRPSNYHVFAHKHWPPTSMHSSTTLDSLITAADSLAVAHHIA